jgi:hypothetical protein
MFGEFAKPQVCPGELPTAGLIAFVFGGSRGAPRRCGSLFFVFMPVSTQTLNDGDSEQSTPRVRTAMSTFV